METIPDSRLSSPTAGGKPTGYAGCHPLKEAFRNRINYDGFVRNPIYGVAACIAGAFRPGGWGRIIALILIFQFSFLNSLAAQNQTTRQPDNKGASPKLTPGPINRLSFDEATEGWFLLFNGYDTRGWRKVYDTKFPEKGWVVKDSALTKLKGEGAESNAGGDIVTDQEYVNFILSLEFKITPGANSGIKYFVTEMEPRMPGSAIGLEYQILDDERHPDAKLGKNGNRKAASLYDLIPAPANKPIKPPGQWNHTIVYVRGSEVEHWLNGKKTVSYNRHSDAFRKLVSESKYKTIERFGEWPKGRILLQDHGDEVSFRNIKIRPI